MEQQIFPSLNLTRVKISPYFIKGIIRHYHYHSYPKLGPGIVDIRRIPRICHACTTILSFYWDSKIQETVNQPRHGKIYNWKYSQILGCHNNWIIMNSLDDVTNEEIYKHINWNILDGNVMNMSLLITKGRYGAIDTDNYLCHG